MKNQKRLPELPSIEELEAELSRKKHAQNRRHLVRNLLYAVLTLIIVSAIVFVLIKFM